MRVTDRVPAWSLAVTSIISVQLGLALSVPLFDVVGAAGTAWLRLCAGAVIFLLVNRPPLRSLRRSDLQLLLPLGLASGFITIAFLTALERIPLGTAVAIEFLGPLGVAVFRSHRRSLLVWPALALVGVVLMTDPWRGDVDLLGVFMAGLAACGWATYILLTQHVADRFTGLEGLSITIPVAAISTAFIGIPQVSGGLSWSVVAAAFGLALLLPVIPFSLEMLALRRLTTSAFGTLMALEPAFALLMGLLLLAQVPHGGQVFGVVLVVVAGIGAARSGHRDPEPTVPFID